MKILGFNSNSQRRYFLLPTYVIYEIVGCYLKGQDKTVDSEKSKIKIKFSPNLALRCTVERILMKYTLYPSQHYLSNCDKNKFN